MMKTNIKTFKIKCFYLIIQKNVHKKHDKRFLFCYPISILYMVFTAEGLLEVAIER